jgi:hypothetical protein
MQRDHPLDGQNSGDSFVRPKTVIKGSKSAGRVGLDPTTRRNVQSRPGQKLDFPNRQRSNRSSTRWVVQYSLLAAHNLMDALLIMRASQRPFWAAGWLIAGVVTFTSPGCGCPKTKPNFPSAQASKTPKLPDATAQPMEKTPLEPSQQNEQEAEDSDSAPRPPKAAQQGKTTETPGATTVPAESGTNAGNASGAPNEQKVSQKASTKPNGNPQDAKRRAKELSAAATKSAGKGNYAQAFREARKGWQAVSGFPEDAECRALTQSLLRQMAQFGSKANTEVELDSRKTLVVE